MENEGQIDLHNPPSLMENFHYKRFKVIIYAIHYRSVQVNKQIPIKTVLSWILIVIYYNVTSEEFLRLDGGIQYKIW